MSTFLIKFEAVCCKNHILQCQILLIGYILDNLVAFLQQNLKEYIVCSELSKWNPNNSFDGITEAQV